MSFEGGCACGAVRYRLNREPIHVQACHCRDCQRLTGSAFVVNMWMEEAEVERLAGETSSHALKGGSGRPHDVHFCPDCGTTLWSRYHGAPKCLFVRLGTLDDPTAFEPGAQIFTRSRLPWVVLPEAMPVYEGFYNPKEHLSEESFARVAALS